MSPVGLSVFIRSASAPFTILWSYDVVMVCHENPHLLISTDQAVIKGPGATQDIFLIIWQLQSLISGASGSF